MKKALSTALAAAAALSVFAAGSGEQAGTAGKPTIRFAYSWQNGFQDTMSAFAASKADKFDLQLEHTSGLDHKQKIQIDVSGGNAPDVFTYWSYEANLGDMARGGLALDVDEYFKATSKAKRSDFSDGAWSATEVDGKNWSIPYESFKGFMAVNKKLLDEAGVAVPKTWDDMKKITPALRAKGIIPLSMGSLRGDAGHLFFSALCYQAPNGYKDTMALKKTGNFKYPGAAQAAQAALDLASWKAIPEDTISSGGWDAQLALYNSRKAAMIYTFPWMLANFDKEIAKDTVIVAVPKIPGAAVDPAGFTVGGIAQGVVVNKKSWADPAKRAAIVELLDFLLSDEMFVTRAKQEGNFPAKKVKVEGMDNEMFNKVVAFTEKQDIYGIHEFFFKTLESFDAYKSANDQLWAGVITKDAFLDTVQKAVDAAK